MKTLPILAITLGDPCGAGPEITAKALSDPQIYEICRPLVVGDACVMRQAIDFVGLRDSLQVRAVTRVEDAAFAFGTIDVYEVGSM